LVQKSDINWIFPWIVIFSLPLLFIAAKERRLSPGIFAALCVIIAFANAFRAHSSVFALFCLIAIIIKQTMHGKFHVRKLFVMLGLTGILLVSYKLFSDIIPYCYAVLSGQSYNPAIGPWHSIYIGLGWTANPFGIVFKDECAVEAVRNINSEIKYLSPEYIETLKNLYFSLFKEHPAYFILNYCKKAIFSFIAIAYFFLIYDTGVITMFAAAILFALNMFLRKSNAISILKEIWQKYSIVFIFALVNLFGLLIYPLMATPSAPYVFGSLASFEMMLFLIITALLECLNNFIIHNAIDGEKEI
jgi:hypothetical protein